MWTHPRSCFPCTGASSGGGEPEWNDVEAAWGLGSVEKDVAMALELGLVFVSRLRFPQPLVWSNFSMSPQQSREISQQHSVGSGGGDAHSGLGQGRSARPCAASTPPSVKQPWDSLVRAGLIREHGGKGIE